MKFTVHRKILFRDCDPAGLVFYPRYFEMLNDCVEAFFGDALGWPFQDLHQDHAVPTARIEAGFPAPSRHGDALDFALSCSALGATSLGLVFQARCADELRLRATSTLVLVDANGKPTRWPGAIRQAVQPFLEADPT